MMGTLRQKAAGGAAVARLSGRLSDHPINKVPRSPCYWRRGGLGAVIGCKIQSDSLGYIHNPYPLAKCLPLSLARDGDYPSKQGGSGTRLPANAVWRYAGNPRLIRHIYPLHGGYSCRPSVWPTIRAPWNIRSSQTDRPAGL